MYAVIHNSELIGRSSARAIDHHYDLMAGIVDVAQDLLKHLVDHGVNGLHGSAAHTRLAMNTNAHLHLVIRELEARLSRSGHRTGLNRNAHSANVGDNLLGNALHLRQLCPSRGCRACALRNKNGARHATAANGKR